MESVYAASDDPVPCSSCGGTLAADAQWCGQCYAVTATASNPLTGVAALRFGGGASLGGVRAPTRVLAAPTPLPPTVVKSRWRKSATTFGPVGRTLATFALVVPFITFVVLSIFTGGLIIAAPVIWGFVIMPWGLRDTWKAGQVSVG